MDAASNRSTQQRTAVTLGATEKKYARPAIVTRANVDCQTIKWPARLEQ
jgi:hypothetical protein